MGPCDRGPMDFGPKHLSEHYDFTLV